MQSNPRQRNPMLDVARLSYRSDALDILRFICAIWVVFAHVIPWADSAANGPATPSYLSAFFQALITIFQPAYETSPAVVIFIVLSGYCVHRNGLRRGRFEGYVLPYAVRRAFRILPVYLLAIAAGAILFEASHRISPTVVEQVSGTTAIDVATLFDRIIGISAFIPSLNYATYAGNAPLHTVMAEIWLYVAYPIGVFAIIRYGEARVFLSIAAIWLCGILACRNNPIAVNWWHNGSLPGFLLYWWIGARFVGTKPSRTIVILAALAWVALSVLLISSISKALIIVEIRKVFFAICIGTVLVMLDKRALVFPKIGAWLAKTGYSLYAFHAPVAYTLLILGVPWFGVVTIVVVMGALIYLVYESPLTKFGRRLSERGIAYEVANPT
jgi:peptidoglycan/LPS O-acetylase OafA/YrhL